MYNKNVTQPDKIKTKAVPSPQVPIKPISTNQAKPTPNHKPNPYQKKMSPTGPLTIFIDL
jgi:hypothetical protein